MVHSLIPSFPTKGQVLGYHFLDPFSVKAFKTLFECNLKSWDNTREFRTWLMSQDFKTSICQGDS